MSEWITESSRGVSSTVGYLLLIVISLISATTVVLVGGAAISDVTNTIESQHAEHAMSQFDSTVAAVAFSGDSQRIQLSSSSNDQISVTDDAGRVKVVTVNDTASRTLVNESFGAVVYRVDDTTVAYQGGGVWRQENDGSTMVSPPEYHYRDQTLTFPIIQVTGGSWSGSPGIPLYVQKEEDQTLYPTTDGQNPLSEGHVHVQITSEYHDGWKSFFESRTEGAVQHDSQNQTVSVNLTVPMTEGFDNAIVATSTDNNAIDDDSTSPHGGFDNPQVTGATRPSVSPRIDQQIVHCESGNCTELESGLSDGTLENGTYFHDGDMTIGETTYDTSNGDIHVVIDGDLTFAGGGGPPGTAHHSIVGGGQVIFHVRGDVTVGGNTGVNTGGDSSDLLVQVHSNGTQISVDGTAQFTGAIYAPNSEFRIHGGGNPGINNVVGAVVVRNATATGNGDLEYSSPVGIEIEFAKVTSITYLHVTEYEITVTGT